MEKQYYLISGLDEGVSIDPYIINDQDNDLDFHLTENGDMCRYYKKLTKDEVIEFLMKKNKQD